MKRGKEVTRQGDNQKDMNEEEEEKKRERGQARKRGKEHR